MVIKMTATATVDSAAGLLKGLAMFAAVLIVGFVLYELYKAIKGVGETVKGLGNTVSDFGKGVSDKVKATKDAIVSAYNTVDKAGSDYIAEQVNPKDPQNNGYGVYPGGFFGFGGGSTQRTVKNVTPDKLPGVFAYKNVNAPKTPYLDMYDQITVENSKVLQ